MKKALLLGVLFSGAAVLVSGCKTLEGVNEDLKKVFQASPTPQPSERQVTRTRPVDSTRTSTVASYPAEEVKRAQTILNQQGYEAGPPDGLFGARTQSALMAFQGDHGLIRSGALDDATMDALWETEVPKDMDASPPHSSPSVPESKVIGVTPPAVETSGGGAGAVDRMAPMPREPKFLRVSEATELKSSADPFSATVGSLRVGQRVELLEERGDWYKVRWGNAEGFVFSDFVR